MLRFKEFLLQEILTPEEEYKVNSIYPERESGISTHLDNHLFSKGIDDVYEPLENSTEKTDTHNKVEDHINKFLSSRSNFIPISISKSDYKNGSIQDPNYKNKKLNIGSLLKNSDLIHDYANDPSRQSKNEEGLQVRITRSKSGIAGQTSHNQSWEDISCKNFNSGDSIDSLPLEYQHGTVVAYLHDKNNKEIARKTFHPYRNDEGNIMYKENAHYGVNHEDFNNKAREIERRLSNPIQDPESIYTIHPEVYNNKGSKIELHSALSEDELLNVMKENPRNSKLLKLVASHDNASKDILDKLIRNPDYKVRMAVLRNKNSDKTHAEIGSNDRDNEVKETAFKHNKISSDTLHKNLHDISLDPYFKIIIAKNKNLSPEDLDHVINHINKKIRFAASENPRLKPHHIDQLLNDNESIIENTIKNNHNKIPKEKLAILAQHTNPGISSLSKKLLERHNAKI